MALQQNVSACCYQNTSFIITDAFIRNPTLNSRASAFKICYFPASCFHETNNYIWNLVFIYPFVYSLSMKKVILLTTIVAAFASCKKEMNTVAIPATASASQNLAGAITTTKATYFDSLFTRYGGGWTGADVGFSYKLPDGRSFWLWGDTFLDTVYPDRHRPVVPFIHNSITLTDAAGNFTTLYGGTAENPTAYFDATEPNQLWTNCAFMRSNKQQLYVLMANIKSTGQGGLFGFELTGNSVGVLNYPDLSIQKVATFSKGDFIDWSSCAFEDGNYVYIYGAESGKYTKFMHASRTSRKNPFKAMEYYDGANWVTDSSKSARLQSGVSEQYSVFKYQNKYYLLSQEGILLSPDIYLWDAASPVGPFSNKRKIYTTPETAGNIITYNATAHTEFIQNGQLLVGYCTNSTNGVDIYRNADYYRPYFIWVSNWQ